MAVTDMKFSTPQSNGSITVIIAIERMTPTGHHDEGKYVSYYSRVADCKKSSEN